MKETDSCASQSNLHFTIFHKKDTCAIISKNTVIAFYYDEDVISSDKMYKQGDVIMKGKGFLLAAAMLAVLLTVTGCDNAGKDMDVTLPTPAAGTSQVTPSLDTLVNAEEEPVTPDEGIVFSKTGYFYTDSIVLEILSSKPGEIYYSLNGSDPDRKQNLYSGPIQLEAFDTVQATSVRAKAFFDDGTESQEITHTYFIGRDAKTRFDTLIFSVTTDPYNLYDYEYGIFVEGKLRDDFLAANPGVKPDPDDPANFNMRGREAEREVYLEVIEPNGNGVIGQKVGIRTYGGWSRAREQKSFKIYARKEYDENNKKLNYEFFPSETSVDGTIIDCYKRLVVRNCGNDNGFAFIRDELFQTLAAQAGYSDNQAVRPVAVFVNGDYRGFFWLHETYCDEYFEDHYGKYQGSFEIIEGGETYHNLDTDGANEEIVKEYDNIYQKFSRKDLTDESNFQSLCEVIDVKNYLEYYAFQVYIGNEDWPQNNYKIYRYYAAPGEEYGKAPFDGKWRYLLHDLDYSFGIYGTSAYTDFLSQYLGPNGEIKEAAPLFGQLMKRDDCREIFVKKTLDLINGAFSEDNLSTVLDSMNAERLNELSKTYYKNLLENWVRPGDLTWRIQSIKDFGKMRAKYILTNYLQRFELGEIYQLKITIPQGCGIQVNSYKTDKAFEGSYYTAYDTTVTGILPEDKEMDYWLVNGERIENEELIVTSSMVKNNVVEISMVTK